MTDETALLAAVADRPDDDTPQLALADWYDDHDRPDDARRIRGDVAIRDVLRGVLADPISDGPRLEYARVCEAWAGEAVCVSCYRGRYHFAAGPDAGPGPTDGPIYYGKPCLRCSGSGRVPDGRAARAEFVRVQCELAHENDIPWKYSCEVRDRLRRRGQELWDRQLGPWFMTIDGPLDDVQLRYRPHNNGGVVGIVRRGFVDELRVASIDVLFGGECGRCGGDGESRRGNGHLWKCPDCSGTGVTSGIAREVFRAHPVLSVRVADMPVVDITGPTGDDEYRYGFWSLPDWLVATAISADGILRWSTPDAANQSLSAAIVAHGRSLVGLPPLPERPADVPRG